MKNARSITQLSLIACLGLFTSFIAHSAQEVSQQELSTLLTEAVAGVNAQAPITLDAETVLESAATVRDLMIYNNTMINFSASDLDAELFSQNIQELVINPLCDNPGLAIFKQYKVTLVYRYIGKDGRFIAELDKDMGTCD